MRGCLPARSLAIQNRRRRAVADNSSTRVPKSAQAFLLSVYRLAVAYYQPKIEARTGVQLGPIDVWEHSKLRDHVIHEYKKSFGFFRSVFFRRVIQNHCVALERMYEECSHNSFANYYKNAIYISFSSSSDHEDWIAEVVVHELAHAVWEKLGGPNYEQRSGLSPPDRGRHELLSEGYATFAQLVWFSDIYPLHVKRDSRNIFRDPDSIYSRGLKRVRQLVSEHGTSILLELPRRWREFSTSD